jgi:DNA primase
VIPQEVIDRILDKVSIVDVVSRYTEVRKSGRNFMALCPFHGEKTPSFSISEEKGLYHCFGCGASGNAVRFLMEYRKLSFTEAVGELAQAAGIDISQYDDARKSDQKSGAKERLLSLHRDAMTFYHESLLKGADGVQAREYFTKRKLTGDTVKKYRLGWGGSGWSACCDYLRSKGYTDAELLLSGVGAKSSRQGAANAAHVYDRFRGRVIFPILDRDGNCIAFGGRILEDGASSAKYVNSPETPVFHKGRTLFSLSFAKDSVTRSKTAIVCEGYMDVIALAQFGVDNVVAPLGTALTTDQLTVLGKYAEEVLFVFDGDDAGIKAANRALDIAVENPLRQGVAILPKKMDPYDYVMTYGADAFRAFLEKQRLSPVEFKLKFFKKGMSRNPDRSKLLLALFPWVARLPGAMKQDEALRRIGSAITTQPELVLSEFAAFRAGDKRTGRYVGALQEGKGKAGASAVGRVDAELLAILVSHPERAMDAAGVVVPAMLGTEEARKLFEFILDSTDKTPKELLERVSDEGIRTLAGRMVMEPELSREYLFEVAWKVRLEYIKRQMSQNTRLLEGYANDPTKEEEVLRVQEETAQLRNESETVRAKLEEYSRAAL